MKTCPASFSLAAEASVTGAPDSGERYRPDIGGRAATVNAASGAGKPDRCGASGPRRCPRLANWRSPSRNWLARGPDSRIPPRSTPPAGAGWHVVSNSPVSPPEQQGLALECKDLWRSASKHLAFYRVDLEAEGSSPAQGTSPAPPSTPANVPEMPVIMPPCSFQGAVRIAWRKVEDRARGLPAISASDGGCLSRRGVKKSPAGPGIFATRILTLTRTSRAAGRATRKCYDDPAAFKAVEGQPPPATPPSPSNASAAASPASSFVPIPIVHMDSAPPERCGWPGLSLSCSLWPSARGRTTRASSTRVISGVRATWHGRLPARLAVPRHSG